MPTTLIEPSRGAAWSPEWRKSVRVTVNMDGRYVLANKRNPKGERCEFPCRIVNISPRAVALAASLVGKPGERVVVEGGDRVRAGQKVRLASSAPAPSETSAPK